MKYLIVLLDLIAGIVAAASNNHDLSTAQNKYIDTAIRLQHKRDILPSLEVVSRSRSIKPRNSNTRLMLRRRDVVHRERKNLNRRSANSLISDEISETLEARSPSDSLKDSSLYKKRLVPRGSPKGGSPKGGIPKGGSPRGDSSGGSKGNSKPGSPQEAPKSLQRTDSRGSTPGRARSGSGGVESPPGSPKAGSSGARSGVVPGAFGSPLPSPHSSPQKPIRHASVPSLQPSRLRESSVRFRFDPESPRARKIDPKVRKSASAPALAGGRGAGPSSPTDRRGAGLGKPIGVTSPRPGTTPIIPGRGSGKPIGVSEPAFPPGRGSGAPIGQTQTSSMVQDSGRPIGTLQQLGDRFYRGSSGSSPNLHRYPSSGSSSSMSGGLRRNLSGGSSSLGSPNTNPFYDPNSP